MKYEFTEKYVTGNEIIDTQHKELFRIANELFEACSVGKGRDTVVSTMSFLIEYVDKHFSDEERLQMVANYPDIDNHKVFHSNYKERLNMILIDLENNGVNIRTLNQVNLAVAALLTHIRNDDKKLGSYLKSVSI